VLDRRVSQAVGRWPELVAALAERGLRRSRSLAVHAAIENIRGIDRRLLTLFWHFAERWGERGPDGVRIPLDLTHQMLSELVGARRPSVTTALGLLRREGLLVPVDGGWVLTGEPPVPS
jgi:CRP-like cAMP-binding protein